MNKFDSLFPENLYHSYIVEGERDEVFQSLQDYLKKRGIISEQSPDTLCQCYDVFTINDNSLVHQWHSKKNISEGKKVCILATRFINREAEHALLKILEEPLENTHFFLIVPRASVLLETVRSRAHIVTVDEKNSLKDAKTFLSLKPKDRIEIVAELIERNKGNDSSGSVRYEAIELINGLEEILHTEFMEDRKNTDLTFSLKELESARLFLGTPGASVKMILEHIALVI